MAFEIKDYFMHYTKRGEPMSLFNVCRFDETSSVLKYYAYQNDEGAYIIQRSTTSSTTSILVYEYYASKTTINFTTDWAGRASLTYGEYYQLFQQAG